MKRGHEDLALALNIVIIIGLLILAITVAVNKNSQSEQSVDFTTTTESIEAEEVPEDVQQVEEIEYEGKKCKRYMVLMPVYNGTTTMMVPMWYSVGCTK